MDQAVNMLAIYCVFAAPDATRLQCHGDGRRGDRWRLDAVNHEAATDVFGGQTRSPLTRVQYQVLSGISQDLSNKEIAAKLSLSERTVKFHVSAMLEKFGARGGWA